MIGKSTVRVVRASQFKRAFRWRKELAKIREQLHKTALTHNTRSYARTILERVRAMPVGSPKRLWEQRMQEEVDLDYERRGSCDAELGAGPEANWL